MSDEDEKLRSLIVACLKGSEEAWHTFVSHYGKVVRGCLLGLFRGNAQKIRQGHSAGFHKTVESGASRLPRDKSLSVSQLPETNCYQRSQNVFSFDCQAGRKEVSLTPDSPSGEDNVSVADVASEAPNPEESTIVAERFEILTNHIHNLSLEQQQIFVMKLKGFKDWEIAQLLAIPDGTVASSYSRIVEKLKKAVKRE